MAFLDLARNRFHQDMKVERMYHKFQLISWWVDCSPFNCSLFLFIG